jgi:hypothetical protein
MQVKKKNQRRKTSSSRPKLPVSEIFLKKNTTYQRAHSKSRKFLCVRERQWERKRDRRSRPRHSFSIRQHTFSIRQHSPAYVSIRQHTSAHVSIPKEELTVLCSARVISRRQHTSAYVSIRQHTSAYRRRSWQYSAPHVSSPGPLSCLAGHTVALSQRLPKFPLPCHLLSWVCRPVVPTSAYVSIR